MSVDRHSNVMVGYFGFGEGSMHAFDHEVKHLWSSNPGAAFTLGADELLYATTDVSSPNEHSSIIVFGIPSPIDLLTAQIIVSMIMMAISFIGTAFSVCQKITPKALKRDRYNLFVNKHNKQQESDSFMSKFEANVVDQGLMILNVMTYSVMMVLIILVHNENIDAVSNYTNSIGSYDHFRDTYFVDSNSVATGSEFTQYEKLCFCESEHLDINSIKCNASLTTCGIDSAYACDDIINSIGYCNLTFYDWNCACSLNIDDSCKVNAMSFPNKKGKKASQLYDDCASTYNLLQALVSALFYIYIGSTVLFIVLAIVLRFKSTIVNWIPSVSAFVEFVLMIVVLSFNKQDICIGSDKLIGFDYPGCVYQYPSDFNSTFNQKSIQTYNAISTILIFYGVKTVIKLQQWVNIFGCLRCC